MQYPLSPQLIFLKAKLHISFHGSSPEGVSGKSLILKLSRIRNLHFPASHEGSPFNDFDIIDVSSRSEEGLFNFERSIFSPSLMLRSQSLL